MASPDEDRENGKRKETSEIILARWSDRFLA
jgi:hypothetical protein